MRVNVKPNDNMEQLTHLNYWDEDSDEFVDHWVIKTLLMVVKYPMVSANRIPNSVEFRLFTQPPQAIP